MEKLSDRVVALRKSLGYNQIKFADMIGESNSKLSIIEKGESKPLYTFIENILDVFPNVSAAWLVKGDGEMFLNGEAPVQGVKIEKRSLKPETKGDMTVDILLLQIEDLKADKRFLQEQLSKH